MMQDSPDARQYNNGIEVEIECMSITPGARWNGAFYYVTGTVLVPEGVEEDDIGILMEWATDEVNGCRWDTTNEIA